MNLIASGVPSDWRNLQEEVAQILLECGMETAVDSKIETVRGSVTVDVEAKDYSQTPPITIVYECKLWKSAVPQTVVHSFRTVVNDCGASLGFIVSLREAQRGAYKAAEHSNVRLVTWTEFQEMYVKRWALTHLLGQLLPECDALVEYTEPMNSRIMRKVQRLSSAERARFVELRDLHRASALFVLHLPYQMVHGGTWHGVDLMTDGSKLDMPFAESVGVPPAFVGAASCLREFLDGYVAYLRSATAEFDALFGERA